MVEFMQVKERKVSPARPRMQSIKIARDKVEQHRRQSEHAISSLASSVITQCQE